MTATIDLTSASDRNLGRVLQLQAMHQPNTNYLVNDQAEYTYAECNRIVNRYARGMQQLGVTPGDRVVIYMKGCIDYVLVTLAVAKLGAVWVPVNTDYKGSWLQENINDSEGKLIVTNDDYLAKVEEIQGSLNCTNVVLHGKPSTNSIVTACLRDFADLDDSDLDTSFIDYGDTVSILWTSGTTGKPKGVMQSHNVWVRSAECANPMFDTRPGDITYNCLPLYNSAAWVTNIYRALVGGITCAMDESFSVSNFWDRIRYYGATQSFTLGAMHMFLWRKPELEEDADNPLRVAQMIPMPDDILEPFRKRFGLEQINQGYGQSEALAMLRRSSEKQWKLNSLGEPFDDLEIKLMDDQGGEVSVGETGEFCIRPKTPYIIFNGYFNNPEATAGAFSGDWYRTGDLGKKDKDGEFFFVDRKSDYIRYKGRNISSMQIEAVARQHPAVADAAVVGIASEELASEAEIKLDIVLKADNTLEPSELARFINDNAPYFFVPRFIEIRESLPYTPTNKVQKYKLREMGISDDTWDRIKADFELAR